MLRTPGEHSFTSLLPPAGADATCPQHLFLFPDCSLVFISSDISPLFSIRGTFIISIQDHLTSPASVFSQSLQPSGRKTAALDQKSCI